MATMHKATFYFIDPNEEFLDAQGIENTINNCDYLPRYELPMTEVIGFPLNNFYRS